MLQQQLLLLWSAWRVLAGMVACVSIVRRATSVGGRRIVCVRCVCIQRGMVVVVAVVLLPAVVDPCG